MTYEEKLAQMMEIDHPVKTIKDLCRSMEVTLDQAIEYFEEIERVAKTINPTPLFRWVLIQRGPEECELGIWMSPQIAEMIGRMEG